MREISNKEYAHDRLGDEFRLALSDYDTTRRLSVLIDEFLPQTVVEGKTVLDVGCGLGQFSQRLHDKGARVTACDLGENLVRRTRESVGCDAVVADCLYLSEKFGEARFDAVVSSECIEHTPSPKRALEEMARVLKPGGYLAVSTPNLVWQPVVRLASRMRLRPFDGLENFSSWRQMRSVLREAGLEIVQEKGLHLFPFQLPLKRLSTWCDERLQCFRGVMINICILARKREL
jgi:2-polyprenyl-3-methyl-5-hydroxy-6-metoxy-1,4-benzoquinol methylase